MPGRDDPLAEQVLNSGRSHGVGFYPRLFRGAPMAGLSGLIVRLRIRLLPLTKTSIVTSRAVVGLRVVNGRRVESKFALLVTVLGVVPAVVLSRVIPLTWLAIEVITRGGGHFEGRVRSSARYLFHQGAVQTVIGTAAGSFHFGI